jgi:hypothetical protein
MLAPARERTSWNVIHQPTVTKIDLFVLREAPFDRSEFVRRERVPVRGSQFLWVKRADDTVLRRSGMNAEDASSLPRSPGHLRRGGDWIRGQGPFGE